MTTIRVYDVQGEAKENLSLNDNLTKKDLSLKTYSCAVRVLLQNWRQGTVGCKTRSEVAFSGKKPWKQKGTGRARAGTISSPLWRKGGVMFGPQPRTRTLKLSQKQKTLVFNNVFFDKYQNGDVICLDFGAKETPSTKMAFNFIKSVGLKNQKIVLFLEHTDILNFSSFRNIPSIQILNFDDPNAFTLTNCSKWVFLKKDFDLFKDMVSKWN